MQCAKCNGTINQGRVDWCQSKGFPCKYCKSCSEANKLAKAQSGGSSPSPKKDDTDWHAIDVSKIVYGYMMEAYKTGKSPREAGNSAYEWYFTQDAVVKSILKKESTAPSHS